MGQLHWSHSADWPAAPGNVLHARHFVCSLLDKHGLHPLVDDARLVVSELAANAVIHASTPFTVAVTRGDASVELSVADGGPFVPVTGQQAVWSQTRGRGLYMVGAYSRDWGVEPMMGGKRVWASFDV